MIDKPPENKTQPVGDKLESLHNISRREFLRLGTFLGSSLATTSLLSGCGVKSNYDHFEKPILTSQSQPKRLNFKARVDELVAQMTLEEKISQMLHDAPAIEHLGVPKYNWWNECLHGVGRAGIATVFPQAIGLAATWNTELIYDVASAISDEARAKHHDALRQGIREIYKGLTFWSPNINIYRDPRWGRGQETYGEDPYLTSRIAVAFVKGLQGDHPHYLKLVATPKHFAVHSGPECERHRFDARPSWRDFRETYLPAFEACVKEGQAGSVMGAYNRTYGEACSASPTLLQKILREEWGFDGYVTSDYLALGDMYKHHQMVPGSVEAAAVAVNAGCDLNAGEAYYALPSAVQQGLVSEETIDQAVKRLFMARFRLGMFDPPEEVPFAQIPYSVNDSPAHRALARRAAQESIVLLKNESGFLPLAKTLRTIAVIGPNADDPEVLLGNYHGTPSFSVTPLQGIRAAVPSSNVLYTAGCTILGNDTSGYAEALALAQQAEIVIFVAGLSPRFEGEESFAEPVSCLEQIRGDRTEIKLPDVQEALLKAIHATGVPVVLLLINGGMIAVNWAKKHLSAIVEAWYPGEEGGSAIADVLFGDYNPSGRLPVTFYKCLIDLPPFTDYRMKGRTYRYFKRKPLFGFGYGLSYTTFSYDNLQVSPDSINPNEALTLSCDVTNTGPRAGDEVIQLYTSRPDTLVPMPIRQLQGFSRIHLQPGQTKTVSFTLTPAQFERINDAGQRILEPGRFRIAIGGSQPNEKSWNGQSHDFIIE